MGEDVEEQLSRILSSPVFTQATRLKSFLRYIVEATQSGRAETLKEYSIGVEVFDRGKDFDPRIDNIVRIQAAKLRSKLLEYYSSGGASDRIVISIPKGSYIPKIEYRHTVKPAAPAATERSRIAVLPFVNMSADPENEYFSDGLTEELINRLASIPSLQVVARTSAFRFKGLNEDLREVGAKLNVGTVLEGSVRRAGDQLRMTAQLIDVQSGYHLFSRTYQREYKDIFELQDELAQSVVSEILPHSGVAPNFSIHTRTGNLDAYNAYLRGMYALGSQFADLRKCLERFREALSLAPAYAPAWAGLAHGYFLLAWFYRETPDIALPLSREASVRTLALDPDSAAGLSSMAAVDCATQWRWESAEVFFRKAIALQPALVQSYMLFVFCCLIPQRRLLEAQETLERALSVDPFNPLLHAAAIDVLGRSGRCADAMGQHRLALNIAPEYAPISAAAGLAHEWCGHLPEAIAEYRKTCELSQNAPYPLSCLGHALAVAGETAEAHDVLERLHQSNAQTAADVARIHVGLRNTEDALRWLEIAVEQRSMYLLRVAGDPRFDCLSSKPQFQTLMRRMQLPVAPGVMSQT
jgi:TolB-like protein/Tfp pilus assembly protein PilF